MMASWTTAPAEERFIDVPGGRVWSRAVGDGPITLLALHGGPASGSASLAPLADLSSRIRVVFYDQLGCGRSDHPEDRDLWQVDRFVQEVDAVRASFQLSAFSLLGHSWGGMLAIEYALAYPERLTALVLASTAASMPLVKHEMHTLLADFSSSEKHLLLTGRLTDVPVDPAVARAAELFDSRHVCRLDPWPDDFRAAHEAFLDKPAYQEMYGHNFLPTGNLQDWDRTDDLTRIDTPTLITVGRFDALPIRCAEEIHARVPNSALHVFEKSSHSGHYEERDEFMRVVGDFIL